MVSSSLTDRFDIGEGVVIAANPHLNYYTVRVIPNVPKQALTFKAYPIGVAGNTVRGVQVTQTYAVGSVVIVAYPAYPVSDFTSIAAVILGHCARMGAVVDKKSRVDANLYSWFGMNSYNFRGYFNHTEKVANGTELFNYTGHGLVDVWPGDFVCTGTNSTLYVSDHQVAIQAGPVEVSVSDVDRRLVENTVLRTVQTIAGNEDIALFGQGVLHTDKKAKDTVTGWGNIVKENSDSIEVDTTKAPEYKTQTQEGGVVYGKHSTVYADDHKTPLSSVHQNYDGSITIESATGITIQRSPEIHAKKYTGKRFAKPITATPDPAIPFDHLDTDWESTPMNPPEDPGDFVSADNWGYPDLEPTLLDDDILGEKSIPIKALQQSITFTEDGGILLKDAYGSSILMNRGNIQFHAANNIFMVAARDIMSIAGGVQTIYAKKDLQLKAETGSIFGYAKRKIHLFSRNVVEILSKTLTDISSTGKAILYGNRVDIYSNKSDINILAQAKLNLAGKYASLRGETAATISTASCGIAAGSNVSILGSLAICGNSVVVADGGVITAMDQMGMPRKTTIGTSTGRVIANKTGGMYAAGQVTGTSITSTGAIAGQTISAIQTDGKVGKVTQPQSITSAVNTPAQLTAPVTPAAPVDGYTIQTTDATDISVSETSGVCGFISAVAMPAGATVDPMELDNQNKPVYIYPGKEFWNSKGVYVYNSTEKTHEPVGGFNTIQFSK